MTARKILVIGNCLSTALSTAVRSYLPGAEVLNLHFQLKDIVAEFQRHAESCDLVFAQLGMDASIYPPEIAGIVEDFIDRYPDRALRYPRLTFPGFHPDCVYAWSRNGQGNMNAGFAYHSAIAVEAFRRGYDVDKTLALFNSETFDALGYFDSYHASLEMLAEECRRTGLPTDVFPRKWLGQAFMLSIDHPRMYVAWDLADHLLRVARQPVLPLDRERNQPDSFFLGPIWPVYPEIAKKLRVPGGYFFMPPTDYSLGARHQVYDLRQFIEKCFDHYRTLDFAQVALAQPTTTDFRQVESAQFDEAFERGAKAANPHGRPLNPYSNTADHQMWRRAIASTPAEQVDPYVRAPFGIERDTRIATAGSCFAQHIAKALERSGYCYYVSETPPSGMAEDAAAASNYGVFSARYGNLYTAKQLLQLLRRAYGEFKPTDNAWMREDGRLVDPFRPQIESEGYASLDELEAARQDHFRSVRAIVEDADVFVFTLGLTESWRSRTDGAVFPLAPGTAGGVYDEDRYEFVNFRTDEVIQDLAEAIAEIRARNPMMRFILTVSPVPLIATCEPQRHVLTATTYSKSVLRVAAEETARQIGGVAYFPSYEIITGSFNRGAYFADGLRDVKMDGVNHVMGLFFQHFATDQWPASERAQEQQGQINVSELTRERITNLYDVVCDEEILDGMSKY